MKKCTFEHEEGDVLYAVTSEAADEPERALRTRTVCKTNWIALAKTWRPLPGNYPTVGPRKKRQLQKQAALSEKSAINVIPTRRCAPNLGRRGKEHTTQRGRPQKHKRMCSPTGSEQDAFPTNMPGLRGWSMMALDRWVRPCVLRPKPRMPRPALYPPGKGTRSSTCARPQS